MRLERQILQNHVRLAKPFANARQRWEERETLVLTLRDEHGTGKGEAAPLPGFSRETLREAEEALAACSIELLQAIAERGCEHPERIWAELEQLAAVTVPSARFALEAALVEYVSARRAEPPSALLRGSAPGPDGLPLARLVGIDNAEVEAEAALSAGFTTLKLKLGTALGFSRELEALQRLRARFGFGFALRLDANQSFPDDEALDRLRALVPLRPEFVEEPTRGTEASAEASPLPVALDESLTDPTRLDANALREGKVRVLVLKPTLLGGLVVTKRFVERARPLGLDWVLSHTFESAVGYRALSMLAFALPPSPLAHGLGPHAALGEPSALGIRGGKLWAPPEEIS